MANVVSVFSYRAAGIVIELYGLQYSMQDHAIYGAAAAANDDPACRLASLGEGTGGMLPM